MTSSPKVPLRLLIVMPSWVGDAAMATPALAAIREKLKGSFIGGLMRPGIDEVLGGTALLDEIHVFQPHGIMAPKHAAAKIRPRRYDAALLLTNSFSTALITRIAGIPIRIGFDKDARGLLLTHPLDEPHDPSIKSKRTPTPAVDWYWALAQQAMNLSTPAPKKPLRLASLPENLFVTLATTPQDEAAAKDILAKAHVSSDSRFAILNPGGNNPAKRWPADRFAAIAADLHSRGMRVLINGSPAESELCNQIATSGNAISLPSLGIRIGSLKALIKRAAILITNDTGPRYFALAFNTPCVALYGPTDTRWTLTPARDPSRHIILRSNPDLPSNLVADDYPEDCRIDRISLDSVRAACDAVLRP